MSSTILACVVARLRREQIPFALIGAGALAAHGVSRSTYDTDLLATDPRALGADTWQGLEFDGCTVDIRVGEADDPLRGVVRFAAHGQAVDLVLGWYEWQRALIERAEASMVMGVELPVVRAADLILLKLYAGGMQDRWDIAQLLGSGPDEQLVSEVEGRLSDLPADSAELWEQIRRGR